MTRISSLLVFALLITVATGCGPSQRGTVTTFTPASSMQQPTLVPGITFINTLTAYDSTNQVMDVEYEMTNTGTTAFVTENFGMQFLRSDVFNSALIDITLDFPGRQTSTAAANITANGFAGRIIQLSSPKLAPGEMVTFRFKIFLGGCSTNDTVQLVVSDITVDGVTLQTTDGASSAVLCG